MFKWLFFIFVCVPCIELMLLVTIGGAVGFPVTLGIILLTGFAGAWLAKRQGLGALRRIQESVNQGHMPADEMVEGILILAAGLLLVTPGFLTDAVGFALLAPPLRRGGCKVVGRFIKRHFKGRVVMGGGVRQDRTTSSRAERTHGRDYEVIDIEAEPVDEE